MKRKWGDSIVSVAGVLLLLGGLYLIKENFNLQGVMRTLPYIGIGIGCGMFGYGVGNIVKSKVIKDNPEIARQAAIDAKDERNLMIANCAKAKSFDQMLYVFAALLISFAFMGVDMAAVLLLVAAYLFVVGTSIYYRCKLEKEM